MNVSLTKTSVPCLLCIFYHSTLYITSNLVTIQSGNWPERSKKVSICICDMNT